MTQELDRVTAVSGDANVKAFLQVIREGESNHTDDAYTLINGGEHFTASPWVHPYAGQSAPPGRAAGAYQFIPHTWERCQIALGLDDFSPVSQDIAAVYLIDAAGALSDVMQGNLVPACSRLASTWVSLPALGADRIARVFQQFGGTVGAESAPVVAGPAPEPPVPAAPTQPDKPMPILALLQMFGPMLAQLIPQIAAQVGGQKDKQNLALAGTILDTVVKNAVGPDATVNAATLGTAVHTMSTDPAVQQKVTQAVVTHPDIMPALQIVEVGGGAAAARAADQVAAQSTEPFWRNSAVFWMSVLLLPLVYWFVGSMIIGGYGQILAKEDIDLPVWAHAMLSIFGSSWTGEARSGGFNLVIGLVLGGICGVYYGVSVTQAKQTAQQQAASDGNAN